MQVLSSLITRPRREIYSNADQRPTNFSLNKKTFQRHELVIQGKRGKITCSWYKELGKFRKICLVYCHGNSGSQLSCEEVLEPTLLSGISLFAFDFSGSGHSDSEVVSLGHFEKDDIETVVNYIYSQTPNCKIILWGRSMGAAASIFYTYCNPHISSMVLDSCFSQFSLAADQIISNYKIVPKFLRTSLLSSASTYIKETYKFDIMKLNPIDFIKNCKIPTIFIHSIEDKLIDFNHSKALFDNIKGPKCLLEINGGHSTMRSRLLVVKTLRTIEYFLANGKCTESEKATARNCLPEFKPNMAELIRHKRRFNQEL